jgi:hypothetical protein
VRAAARQRVHRRRGHENLRGPLLRECQTPYKRTSGQVIAVLMYRNGGRRVEWPDRREDHAKPLFRGAFTAFEVALGRHVTEFDIELPAAGDSEFFEARAHVHWEVEDPCLVVDRLVWNAAEMLHDDLLERLRDVSRRFTLTQAERVEQAVKAELSSDRFALGEDLGLWTKVHVFIDLSERVADQAKEHTDLDHETALVRKRALQFEAMLRSGNIAQIAHFMARDPERALDIRNLIRQEWRDEQQITLDLFGRLLDSGHLERHDIGEHMYEVIEYLRERSDGVIGNTVDRVLATGRGARPALPSGGGQPRKWFWEEDEDDAGDAPTGDPSGNADDIDDADIVGGGDWDNRTTSDRTRRDPGRQQSRSDRASEAFDDWDAS